MNSPHFSTNSGIPPALLDAAHPVRAGAHLARALLAECREGQRTRSAPGPEQPALDARTHECAREARASPRTRACRAGRFCRPRARFCPTRHARREEPAPDNERRCSPRNSGSPKPLLTYQTASFSRRTFGVRRTAPTASSSKRNMRKRGPIGPRFRIFLLLDDAVGAVLLTPKVLREKLAVWYVNNGFGLPEFRGEQRLSLSGAGSSRRACRVGQNRARGRQNRPARHARVRGLARASRAHS